MSEYEDEAQNCHEKVYGCARLVKKNIYFFKIMHIQATCKRNKFSTRAVLKLPQNVRHFHF